MLLEQIQETFSRRLESLQKYVIVWDIISKIGTGTWIVSDSKEIKQVVQFGGSIGPTFKLN